MSEDSTAEKTKIFTSKNYTIFPLWDTYRALDLLYTLIQRKKDADFINSMLALYDQSTEYMLPIWSLGDQRNLVYDWLSRCGSYH
jgi:putative alpha-1,2-mannosidase